MKTILIKIFCLFIIALSINTFIYSNTLAAAGQNYKCPYTTPADCLAWSLNQTGDKAGYGAEADSKELTATQGMISSKVGLIISYALAFLGVLFLVISIMAGLQWMTAGGNEDKIKQARSKLTSAIMGLVIIIMAYAITWFIVSKLQSSVNYVPPQAYTGPACTQAFATECQAYCTTLSKTPSGCVNAQCQCS